MTELSQTQAFANHMNVSGWVLTADQHYGTVLFNLSKGITLTEQSIAGTFYEWSGGIGRAPSITALQKTQIIPYVIGQEFNPETTDRYFKSGSGFNTLNTYTPFYRIPENPELDKTLTAYHKFMSHCFPVEQERSVVELWIAHMVQYPAYRKPWHLMLTGTKGTGKGTLVEMLEMMTPNHQSVDDFAKVNDMHSTVFNGTILLHLNDVKSLSESQQTRIKAKLSDSSISVRRLYKEAAVEKIYTRVILSSNDARPLRLDAEERRWFCPTRMEKTQDTQDFKEWLKAGGINFVYDHLMSLDVSPLPNVAPKTATFYDMVEASRSVLDVELESFLDKHKVFQIAAVSDLFGRDSQIASHKLTEHNYKRSRPFQKVVSKRYKTTTNTWFWHHKDLPLDRVREIIDTGDDPGDDAETTLETTLQIF